MRRPRAEGGAIICTSDAGTTHTPTFTCSHCNVIRTIPPRCTVHEAPDLCVMCMKLICPRCAEARARGARCVPFEQQCDVIEARDRLYRQISGDDR